MAKGNDRGFFSKREKRGKKNQRLVVEQGMVSEYALTNLHIALRPLNIAQKTMYCTVMLISGRVFWNLVQDRSSFQSSASQKTEGKTNRCRQTNRFRQTTRPIIRYIEMWIDREIFKVKINGKVLGNHPLVWKVWMVSVRSDDDSNNNKNDDEGSWLRRHTTEPLEFLV